MIKRIQKLLENINEATLEQTLSSFDVDKFTDLYIEAISAESGGFPESELENIADMIASDDYLNAKFYEETKHDVKELSLSYFQKKDRNIILKSRIFKDIIKKQLNRELTYAISELKKIIIGGKIKIYRFLEYDLSVSKGFLGKTGRRQQMGVPPEKSYIDHLAKYGGKLGIYWTADRETIDVLVETVSQVGELTKYAYLIESEVTENKVNWYDTLLQRVHPEYGDYSGFSPEKEIRLFKGTPLKLISLSQYDEHKEDWKKLNISPIVNKIFYA